MWPAVAGSQSYGQPPQRTPAPPRHIGPWRRPRRPLVLAPRPRGPRGPRLPRGRELIHRRGDGPAGRPPRRPLRGDEGQDQRDRHVGADPAGTVVVLLA